MEINLTNIRESPIISRPETAKKVDTVRRADQRQEVERLFVDGDHKQVAELLWITLKSNPTIDETQPLPQERANQLQSSNSYKIMIFMKISLFGPKF